MGDKTPCTGSKVGRPYFVTDRVQGNPGAGAGTAENRDTELMEQAFAGVTGQLVQTLARIAWDQPERLRSVVVGDLPNRDLYWDLAD
jgi:hypothetical protein